MTPHEKPLVDLRSVSMIYQRPDGTEFKALDDVSMKIGHGQTFALIGESGSGKSTLARLVLGLQSPSDGRVWIGGRDIGTQTRVKMRALRSRIGAVFQEPFEALNPRMSIGHIIEEPLVIHQPKLSRSERRERVLKMLAEVELDPSYVDRYPAALSGGQQQRIGIARALIGEPDLVVLDEPTSSLDLTIRTQVLSLLTRLRNARNLTYLLITHDLASVENFASHVGVLYRGRMMETGETAQVLYASKESYTRELLSARLTY
nr:dipeptide/oligopeptide/nickel ABC transporter ATP-binding protein [uncultured Cohaesibacter sp.]